MEYINRDIEKMIHELSKEYACILITGPRQVGKSTLLDHIDGSRNKVSLDDISERNLAKTDPEMFLNIHKTPLTIDEVQYAPELFSYIKIAIDNGAAPGSFFLTGSHIYSLMNLAQESLAGRVAILNLTSLSQNEIYGDNNLTPFDVDIENLRDRAVNKKSADINTIYKRIFEGGMPALISGKNKNRDVYYHSYIQTYIRRDVKDEIDLKDEVKFYDFVRAVACRVGQVLNIHSIAQDVEVHDSTAKKWLFLLEKSEIVYYLHPYSNNLLTRTIKAPKLYFFDTGLVAYLTKHSSPEILQNSAINGAILENFVINEIRKTYINSCQEIYMYYYRDKDMKEIDIILETNNVIHPIEIKKTSNPIESMIKTFDLLKKSNIPVGQGAIICMTKELSALDRNTLIIPIWYI